MVSYKIYSQIVWGAEKLQKCELFNDQKNN